MKSVLSANLWDLGEFDFDTKNMTSSVSWSTPMVQVEIDIVNQINKRLIECFNVCLDRVQLVHYSHTENCKVMDYTTTLFHADGWAYVPNYSKLMDSHVLYMFLWANKLPTELKRICGKQVYTLKCKTGYLVNNEYWHHRRPFIPPEVERNFIRGYLAVPQNGLKCL